MSDIQVFDKGEKATKIGLIVVAFLGLVKGAVGLFSGSVSLTAQAVDSLTDLVSLIAVFMGLRISRKPPSDRFTYGYYRVETLVSLLISLIILATGGLMLMESWNQISSPTPITDPLLVFSVAGVSIPVLMALGRYTMRVGKEINSQALQSQSEDFMTDVYSSAVVCVGVGGYYLGFPVVEGVAGGIISLLIIKMGVGLSWNSILSLMDAVEDPDRLFEVKRLAESIPGVLEAKGVRMRRSGPFCLGEVTILVGEELDVDKAHRLSHLVEDKVKNGIDGVESLVVHIEPTKRERHRLAFPVDEDKGLESKVSAHFGSARYFLFVDIGINGVERWYSKENDAFELEKKRGVTVSDMIMGEETTAIVSDELGEGPFHILRDNYISVYQYEGENTARELVDKFLGGELHTRTDSGKSDSNTQ